MMLYNLMSEIVKTGVMPERVVKTVAQTIGCTEKTARNKISGKTDFSIREAILLNQAIFKNEKSIEYLFADGTGKNQKRK